MLPELALHWRIPGNQLEMAITVPGPETDVFAELARRHETRILVGALERSGDAVHNSAILIDADGTVAGVYRKVHLAANGEDQSGLTPGNQLPVFDTGIGRIGCNICMDSTSVEASPVLGLQRADLLLLPTLGDLRAGASATGSSTRAAGRRSCGLGRWTTTSSSSPP